jgi:hypothetical protein
VSERAFRGETESVATLIVVQSVTGELEGALGFLFFFSFFLFFFCFWLFLNFVAAFSSLRERESDSVKAMNSCSWRCVAASQSKVRSLA